MDTRRATKPRSRPITCCNRLSLGISNRCMAKQRPQRHRRANRHRAIWGPSTQSGGNNRSIGKFTSVLQYATQLQRARAIYKAMREVKKEQVTRWISFGLNHTHGPKGGENTNDPHSLPAGAKVLVHRTCSKQWEVPHMFVSTYCETAIMQTQRGRSILRSTCVKPYNTPSSTTSAIRESASAVTKSSFPHTDDYLHYTVTSTHAATAAPPKIEKKGQAMLKKKVRDAVEFGTSRKEKLNGLINNRTFVPTHMDDLPPNTRVFGSRFIDKMEKGNLGVQ